MFESGGDSFKNAYKSNCIIYNEVKEEVEEEEEEGICKSTRN